MKVRFSLHQVTTQDKDLLIAVKDIIREDSKREKCEQALICAVDYVLVVIQYE